MPVIKGTSSISDDRVREKLLKKTKFPSNFKRSVQFNKIHRPVIVKWIQDRLTELQNGVEDEIVQQMAVNLFLPPEDAETDFNARDKIQPKKAQLDLAGFLGDNEAAVFSKELWTLLLEAQETSNGIPPSLIERKKKELLAKQRSVAQPHSNVAPDPQMTSILQEAQRRAQAARAVLERQQIQQWQRTMQQNQQQAFADPRGVPPLAAMPAPVGDLRGVPPMVVPPEEQKPSAEQVNPSRTNEDGANIKADLNDNDEDDDKTVDLNDDDDKTVDLNERKKSDKGGDKSEDDGRDKKRRRKSSDRDKSNNNDPTDKRLKREIKVSDRRRDRKIRNDSPERKRGSKHSRRRDWDNKHSDSNSDTSYNENGNVKQQNGKGNRDRGRKLDSGSDRSSSDRCSRSRSSSPERDSRGRVRRRSGKGYKRRYSSRSNSSACSRSISLSRSRSRSRSLSSSRSRRSRSLSSRSWSRSPSPSPRRERKKEDDNSINSERSRARDNKRRRGENRDRRGNDEDRRNDRDRSETMKKRGDQYPDNRNSNHYRSRNRDRFGNTAARDRLPGSGRGGDGSSRRRDADDPSRQHFSR